MDPKVVEMMGEQGLLPSGHSNMAPGDIAEIQRLTERIKQLEREAKGTPATQDWTHRLPVMQQSVLLTAVRGPDGLPKYHPSKYLLRWYRRCILVSAMDKRVLRDPAEPNGGSFTGPSVEGYPSYEEAHHYRAIASVRSGRTDAASNEWRDTALEAMDDWVDAYLQALDEIPHHFQLHFMHGVEILGFKHPDPDSRAWWNKTYLRLVWDMHLRPESEEDLDDRLGDSRERWLKYADRATQA